MSLVNQNFGSVQTLQSAVRQAHSSGLYVMVDVVINHMGNQVMRVARVHGVYLYD